MGDFIEDKLSDLDEIEKEFAKNHKDAKKYKQDVEKAHIALTKLITNIQLLISATDAVKQLKPSDVKAFTGLSESFTNRQVMTNYEVSELIDVMKQISTQIKANPKDATTVNPNNYADTVDRIMANQSIPDAVKEYVTTISADTLTNIAIQISGQTKLMAENKDEIKRIIGMIKNQKDLAFTVPVDKQVKELYQADNLLNEYTDSKSKTTVEMLAKRRGKDVSQGSIAGSISYMEDMLDVKGSSDFLSEKMGDIFGIKNIKEKMISGIGKSIKGIYSGVEKFLPEVLKLDEKRFYGLNKEILSVNEKILDGLDSEIAKTAIKRDKTNAKIKKQLEEGKLSEDEYNSMQEALNSEFETKTKDLDAKREKIMATMEKSAESVFNIDMSQVEEKMYKNLVKNKQDLEKDLSERLSRGLISEDEATKARETFGRTETKMKSGFESEYRSDSQFDIEKYIKDSVSYASTSKDSLEEINKNTQATTKAVNELISSQQEIAREARAKDDAKFSADGRTSKESEKAPKVAMPEKKEKDDGGGFDLFGDLFGGGNEKGKRKAKGKAGKMSKMGTFAKMGGGLLETAGSALWKAKGGIGSLAGGLALDYGSEKLDETGHDTMAKIARIGSSALTGAGMGGLAGSVVPVLGTTAGAVIGGIGGLGKGIYDNFFGGDDKDKKKEDESKRPIEVVNIVTPNDNNATVPTTVPNFKQTDVKTPVAKQTDYVAVDKEKVSKDATDEMNQHLLNISKKDTVVHVSTGGGNPAPIVSTTDKQSNDLGIIFVNNGMFS